MRTVLATALSITGLTLSDVYKRVGWTNRVAGGIGMTLRVGRTLKVSERYIRGLWSFAEAEMMLLGCSRPTQYSGCEPDCDEQPYTEPYVWWWWEDGGGDSASYPIFCNVANSRGRGQAFSRGACKC
jgi:hypothetical protein